MAGSGRAMPSEATGDLFPDPLASGFDRWRVTIPAGSERATSAAEWAGALVVVEEGVLEVVCGAGACRSFGRGSFLSLSWLPVARLRNPGAVDTVIVGYRRRTEVDAVPAVPCPP